MSLEAMVWAANHAPIADVHEFAVLIKMADRADEVGRGVWFGQRTLASRVTLSDRKVRDTLAAMKDRGLIGLGDQRRVLHIRADKRPIVYDLLIPHSYFRDIARTNEDLARKGEPPITPENRPDIGAPPPKKRRADLGVAKKRNVDDGTSGNVTGGLAVRSSLTPDGSDSTAGIEVRPEYKSSTGGIQEQHGRTAIPPIPSFEQSINPPPPTDADHEPEEEGGSGIPGEDSDPVPQVLADLLAGVPRSRWPNNGQYSRLAAEVSTALQNGWTRSTLVDTLRGDFSSANSVYAALKWRLGQLGDPADAPPGYPAAVPVQRSVAAAECRIGLCGGEQYITVGAHDLGCPSCSPNTHRRDLARASERGLTVTTFEQLRQVLEASPV